MRQSLEEVTRDMLSGLIPWPGPTLCMKKRRDWINAARPFGVLLPGLNGAFIVTNHHDGMSKPFVETHSTIDEVLNAGWVVD